MEVEYVARGRIKYRTKMMTYLHYYRVELFCLMINMQSLELNQCFDEVNINFLLCMACFDPRDSFSAFHKDKLFHLAKILPIWIFWNCFVWSSKSTWKLYFGCVFGQIFSGSIGDWRSCLKYGCNNKSYYFSISLSIS